MLIASSSNNCELSRTQKKKKARHKINRSVVRELMSNRITVLSWNEQDRKRVNQIPLFLSRLSCYIYIFFRPSWCTSVSSSSRSSNNRAITYLKYLSHHSHARRCSSWHGAPAVRRTITFSVVGDGVCIQYYYLLYMLKYSASWACATWAQQGLFVCSACPRSSI